ncbi:MAG: LuxR C-terminal-related transcriptional regulator [Chitinophagaceae bacterium]
MSSNIAKEADKIWKRLTVAGPVKELNFEMEVYKELLDFFMPGDYYYYIFNVREGAFEFVSEEAVKVLGYQPGELTVPFIIEQIHPDDQPWFLNYENKLVEFFSDPSRISHYKVRYDYRLKKKNGDYIRILQQVVTIQEENGAVVRTLGIHTDISHLKLNGAPVLSLIGLNGAPSYYDVEVEKKFKTSISGLTRREMEIIRMLAKGQSSDVIGKTFSISKQTVDTHRKNLLKKTGCTNSAELVSIALKKGWI